jgi:hypothetical protein
MSQGTLNKVYNPNSKSLNVDSDYKNATSDFTQSNLDGSNNIALGTEVDAVAISNDGTNDITVTILTKTYIIKQGEIREIRMSSQFNTVNFSANAIFRCVGMVA